MRPPRVAGGGKSFTARWLQARARQAGLATWEVQISENAPPAAPPRDGLPQRDGGPAHARVVGGHFPRADRELVLHPGGGGARHRCVDPRSRPPRRPGGQATRGRLADVSAIQPQFAAALRACHRARVEEHVTTAEGRVAWLMGQPNEGDAVKRKTGIKGDIDQTSV